MHSTCISLIPSPLSTLGVSLFGHGIEFRECIFLTIDETITIGEEGELDLHKHLRALGYYYY